MTNPQETLNHIMAEALATHINAELVQPNVVQVRDVPMTLECYVGNPTSHPGVEVVEVSFGIRGNIFGDVTLWDSCGGYGETATHAVVQAVHNWTHGPYHALLQAVVGGECTNRYMTEGMNLDAYEDDVQIRGAGQAATELHGQLTALSPFSRLIKADLLPLLSPQRAHIITCYGNRAASGQVTIEVRIDGMNWPYANQAFNSLTWPEGAAFLSFRQLAVVNPVPASGPILTPINYGRLIARLRAADPHLQRFGACEHKYSVAPPLGDEAVTALERESGVLFPQAYRQFLSAVAGQGAGPFFGLLAPNLQVGHLKGPFRFTAETAAETVEADDCDDSLIRGTLGLAHLGCGYMALLVVDGTARGQVWTDLRSAGLGLVPTNSNFTDWLTQGLDDLFLGRLPMIAQIRSQCALPNAISSFFKSLPSDVNPREALAELPDGAVATCSSGHSRFFENGQAIDVCPMCLGLANNLGMRRAQLVSGTPPRLQAR